MPEVIVYEHGEFTDFSKELPLTEEQREALAKLVNDPEEQDGKGVHRIIIDMEY